MSEAQLKHTELIEAGPAAATANKPSRFDRRKSEILDAAGGLFNRRGLKDSTLEVVAAEIGLNLKSLRYYFKRRDDLVAAAFMRSIAKHLALAEGALAVDDFDERIRFFISSYFAMQARIRKGEEPELVHFGDLRALSEPHLGEVGDAYVGMFRVVRRLFRPAEMSWTPEQCNANAHLLLSQLHWSVIWLHGYVDDDFERVADRLSDILLKGIGSKALGLKIAITRVPTPFSESDRLSQESFLCAATKLINDQGYKGASVDRISAELGVTKGAFYHHNENLDALMVACFERTFSIIRQAQGFALRQEADGMSHVAAAATSLVSRQMVPEGVVLRTSALTAIGPELRHEMEQRLALLTWRFQDMLNDGVIDGSVRLCDMRIAAEAVTAMINSAQELQRWVPTATFANAAELYVRPLFRGLSR